ncbi:MAG TPA: lipopolysaccharide kinase InaA family protein [Patescibacteria group bacterium]|nr:lipopolysaccharide kinase InaA family protein [Patescibacteria group bacterium]
MTTFEYPPQENKEALAEKLVELALTKGQKINEGTNGVIFEIDLNDCPEEFTGLLKKNPGEKFTAKMLKIYLRGAGEKEARFQQQAFDLVAGQNDPELAKIPEIYLYQDFAITNEELKDKLAETGIKENERAEVLFMDYIHGQDLATYLYTQILNKEHGTEKNSQWQMDFNQLQKLVGELLHFTEPTAKQRTTSELFYLVVKENEEKIKEFLKRNDITLAKAILDKVAKTVSLLNKNGIYHNDLHERNIILEQNKQGELTDVYIIDFGDAEQKPDQQRPGGDLDMVGRLTDLTKSRQEKKDETLDDLTVKLKRLIEHYSGKEASPKNRESFEHYKKSIKEALANEDFEDLYSIVFSCDEPEREKFIAAIVLTLNESEKETMAEFIKNHLGKQKISNRQLWFDLEKLI